MTELGLLFGIFERSSARLFHERFFLSAFGGVVAGSTGVCLDDGGNGDIGESSLGSLNITLRGLQVLRGRCFSRIFEEF